MAVLRINLFGRFSACYKGQPVAGLDTRKVQELFCYLLLYRNRPHPREALASLLWDESHTKKPIRCLRKTLWQLRNALDSQGKQLSDHVLLVEPEWVQLTNPDQDLWLDIAVFEQAFNDVQAIQDNDLESQHLEALRTAANLYRGGLQENWYHDWYLYERERLQHMYLVMLDKLIGYSETHCKYEMGLTYGALVLRCERAHERTHRRLMRLHYSTGDRTAALHQYDLCKAALREELGVRPAKRTVALFEQIRSDQLLVPRSSQVADRRSLESTFSSLPDMMARLKRFHESIVEIQRELNSIFENWNWS